MNITLAVKISAYLCALIIANFIVFNFGKYGLLFTAFFLIPFDFVIRCDFHETWTGKNLFIRLLMLVLTASTLTFFLNPETAKISLASSISFLLSSVAASIFYQIFITKSFLFKVNGSDFIAIICDSIVFQLIAFNSFLISVAIYQILLKFCGGLLWYFILFYLLKGDLNYEKRKNK